MKISLQILDLSNDHFQVPQDESLEITLKDSRLTDQKRGSLVVLHLSRNVDGTIVKHPNIASGSLLLLENSITECPEDTCVVVRFYDWVHNYDRKTRRSHVWCLNAVFQSAYRLHDQTIQTNDHLRVTFRLKVEGVTLTPKPFTNLEEQQQWQDYQKGQRDLYHSAHPPLVSALDCIDVFDFDVLDSCAAGFTFVRIPNPKNQICENPVFLMNMYRYGLLRYQWLYGTLAPVDLNRLMNLILPLASLAMPYKPDFSYRGSVRQPIDYFDDPFLTESGDCEDLSLGTLRIAEWFQRSSFSDPDIQTFQNHLKTYYFGLGLISININGAHMTCWAFPKEDKKVPWLLESTAPTVFEKRKNTVVSENDFKCYENRSWIYNFLVTWLQNDDKRPEWTFLSGSAHGIDINTLLSTNVTLDSVGLERYYDRKQQAILEHMGRNQVPYVEPIATPFSSDIIMSQGTMNEQWPSQMALFNVHTYLKMVRENKFQSFLKEHGLKGFKVVRQTITPTLETFCMVMQ